MDRAARAPISEDFTTVVKRDAPIEVTAYKRHLGHMRWNLAVQYGPEVAARFLEMYEKRQGATFEHDRYWDVVTLVDFLADVAPASPLPRRSVDQLERYLTGVLAAL